MDLVILTGDGSLWLKLFSPGSIHPKNDFSFTSVLYPLLTVILTVLVSISESFLPFLQRKEGSDTDKSRPFCLCFVETMENQKNGPRKKDECGIYDHRTHFLNRRMVGE